LLINERKTLRRIFRPTKDGEGTLKIKTNDELNNLIRNKNIINYIKAQRLSRFGHAHQMTKDRIDKKLYEWKLISTGLPGRPKIRWETDIKEDSSIMKINKWTKCIQDWVKWKEVVEKPKLSKSEVVASDEEE